MTHYAVMPDEQVPTNHFCHFPERPSEITLFRTIAHAIFDQVQGAERKVVMLTSCHPGAGVSFVASAIGVELARTAGEVLIADAEVISKLAHCGSDRVASSLRRIAPGRIWVLDREQVERCASTELSGSPLGLEAVLATMRMLFPYVLIDAPAFFTTAHVLSFCGAVDGTVLIVGDKQTDIHSVAEAYGRITTLGGRVIGSILNFHCLQNSSGHSHAQIS
jgi:Mrp family chromosome partitioning ATPase